MVLLVAVVIANDLSKHATEIGTTMITTITASQIKISLNNAINMAPLSAAVFEVGHHDK